MLNYSYVAFELSKPLNVWGQLWNLKCEYEARLAVGLEKILAVENAKGRENTIDAMLEHWQGIEAGYKRVHDFFAGEIPLIRNNQTCTYKSIEEIKRLLQL